MEEMPRSRRHEGYELLPKDFPGGELLGPYADVLRMDHCARKRV